VTAPYADPQVPVRSEADVEVHPVWRKPATIRLESTDALVVEEEPSTPTAWLEPTSLWITSPGSAARLSTARPDSPARNLKPLALILLGGQRPRGEADKDAHWDPP
jgi:hypothetical protein